ncbi:MAG: hypothetical protein ACOKSU_25990 [Pseudomonas sp.]|uniref:hypothetical protein n=1 Tax=Pseudomonas TaxID=286 RepID=UPI0003C07098|nr:hypothetical protein [Pseudomonas sp. VLB120]AGZ34719.1 hypothetical protein PVLB_09615 [Pseudomonas sp. VLB120]
MQNSKKVIDELNSATRKINQALRASGTNRPDPQSAADCFNRLTAAILDIDARLVVVEKSLESAKSVEKAD